MDWIHLNWRLRINEQNERVDEPALQFAFVTIKDGEVNVHGHDTGKLQSGTILHWGTIRSGRSVPDTDNPYLGVVVRAIELDNSGSDNRTKDRDRFFNVIKNFTQRIVDSGEIPSAEQLLLAGIQLNLIDDDGNDDDRIGVNARAFPDIGSLYLTERNIIPYYYNVSISDEREGNSYSSTHRRLTNLQFTENCAHYEMVGQVVITPDEPIISYP